MTEHTVVMHRPPLKRIDTDVQWPKVEPEAISEGTRALRELGARIENERIWDHVRRTAQGCNPASEVGK